MSLVGKSRQNCRVFVRFVVASDMLLKTSNRSLVVAALRKSVAEQVFAAPTVATSRGGATVLKVGGQFFLTRPPHFLASGGQNIA